MIVDSIIGIIANVINELSEDKWRRLFNKISKKRLIDSLSKDTRELCEKNESIYLNSGDFETFITHNHPVERILENAFDIDNPQNISQITEKLIGEAQNIADIHGYKLTQDDKGFIKNLCSMLDNRVNQFYQKKLSDSEKYMLSQQKSSINSMSDSFNAKLDKFMNCLESRRETKLSNNDEEEVAKFISDNIMIGEFAVFDKLLPLIEGRSEDLILYIGILRRELFSTSEDLKMTYDEIKKISNTSIKEYVIKIILPIIYLRGIAIKGWDTFCSNDVLKRIVLSIENKDYGAIIKQNIVDDSDGLKKCEIVISKEALKGEGCLTKQLVSVYLYKNINITVPHLLDNVGIDMDSWLNRLLQYSRELVLSIYESAFNDKKQALKDIVDDLIKDETVYSLLSTDIKNIYYDTLVRGLLYLKDDRIEEIISSIPQDVREYYPVKEQIVEYKIKNKEIDLKDVLSFCDENDRYGLMHAYVVENCSIEETIDLIENNNIDLNKCSELFFMYVSALVIKGNKEKAKQMLEDYYQKYNEFFEYWNLLLEISDSESNINEFTAKCQNNTIKVQFAYSELTIIKRLIQLGKYELANKYIEYLVNQNRYLLEANKFRALILKLQHKFLECLELLKIIFEKDQEDEMVLDDILSISLLEKRDIDEKYIDIASKSSNARLLSLAADAYATKRKMVDARKTMIKALLADDDYKNIAFARYLALNIEENESEKEYTRVEKNTAVFLKSDNGDTKVICIYEDDVLPKSPYKWNGDMHLYISEAAGKGIYGNSINNKVFIDNVEYCISEIISLDVYFARISFSNVEKSGLAKSFQIPVKDGELDIEAFALQLKEMVGDDSEKSNLIESYNDYAKLPLPIFTIKSDSNATYTHLIMVLLEDQNICLREGRANTTKKSNNYVLSYASMIVMMKIGITPEEINNHNTYIPESAVVQARDDVNEMLKRYNKETVCSLGINEGKPYLNEENEESKNRWIKEAGKCKDYVDRLEIVTNNLDWSITGVEPRGIKNTLGMADYDAIAIGKKDKYTVVTTESMISQVGFDSNMNVNTISITSWLINNDFSCLDVIDYVHEMIGLGCVLSINEDFIWFVFKEYEKSNSQDKNLILKKMDSIFDEYDEMSETYREYAVLELMKCLKPLLLELNSTSQLFRLVLGHIIKLLDIRVTVQIDENGEPLVEVEQLDRY